MSRRPSGAARHSRLWAGAGGLLLAAAAAGAVYPLWWEHRSTSAGHKLLELALSPVPASTSGARLVATCGNGPTTGGVPGSLKRTSVGTGPSGTRRREHPGVLEIPAIDLEAPVLQGLSDAVFDTAVGHDPASAWPGSKGESLLLAHDVSYFSALGELHDGDAVIWIDGCTEALFRVVRHEIALPGATIWSPPGGRGLALITCSPSDALFWTSDRYVVETSFVLDRTVKRSPSIAPTALVRLTVPAPPALQAEGLSLDRSGVSVGDLSFAGSPSRSFRESSDPLEVANVAVSDYAAAEKAAAARNPIWWSDLAMPQVPLPAPWSLRYDTNVTLSVNGSTVDTVTLSTPEERVVLTVHHSTFYVAHVSPQT